MKGLIIIVLIFLTSCATTQVTPKVTTTKIMTPTSTIVELIDSADMYKYCNIEK